MKTAYVLFKCPVGMEEERPFMVCHSMAEVKKVEEWLANDGRLQIYVLDWKLLPAFGDDMEEVLEAFEEAGC